MVPKPPSQRPKLDSSASFPQPSLQNPRSSFNRNPNFPPKSDKLDHQMEGTLMYQGCTRFGELADQGSVSTALAHMNFCL
ncbi:pentatricopeptide repeat-containing protein [Corchorus olitorius]|uniref:Pentatricopeptide repeat-containing protein n=1 Tax=Corchorus olitorius TaxID=93759 RepID=A0A1R3KDW3_9ROSI|nr:pentatricopeptide repeat-containing protein [Corchorus olitorius]